MKILVIQTAFIGDAILATALLEKLHRFYPEAQLDCLVRKGNEGLFGGHPFLGQCWVWDKKNGKYKNLLRILRGIRAMRYDIVVNCQRFAASGFLTAFSRAKQKIGFDKNPFSELFSKKIPHHIGVGPSRFGLPYWHEVDRNLSLIDHLTDTTPERPRLFPSATDYTRALELAAGQSYVCMAPTSVWFTKQWPPEKWSALIRSMPAQQRIFLLGAPSDVQACADIASACPGRDVVNLAGKIGLLTSAALMQNAIMNYVNDSAPLHLASSMNAPVTAIFCSTVPSFGFTPLSDVSMIWENKDLDCRPCGLHGHAACPKGHFRCSEVG